MEILFTLGHSEGGVALAQHEGCEKGHRKQGEWLLSSLCEDRQQRGLFWCNRVHIFQVAQQERRGMLDALGNRVNYFPGYRGTLPSAFFEHSEGIREGPNFPFSRGRQIQVSTVFKTLSVTPFLTSG